MRTNTNVIGFAVASFAVVSVVVITKLSSKGLYWSYFSSYAGTWTTFLRVTSDPSSSQTNSAFPSFIAVIFILSIIIHPFLYFHYSLFYFERNNAYIGFIR